MMAERLQAITAAAGVPFIYKSSYDKANRLSVRSYRGPGPHRGPAHPRSVKEGHAGSPVLSDVHDVSAGRAGGRDARRAPGAGLPVPADRLAPRVRAERPAGQREEGTVPRAARHGQCRREDSLRGQRGALADGARDELRLQQPRGGLPRAADHARIRLSRDLRRHALGAAPGRAGRPLRAASASTSRPSPAPPSRSASTRCSWRSTRTPTARCRTAVRCPTARTCCASTTCRACSPRSRRSARARVRRDGRRAAPRARRARAAHRGPSGARPDGAARRALHRGGRPDARVRGPRDRDGHGQVGAGRAARSPRRSRARGRRPTSSTPPRAFTATSASWRGATSCWRCRIRGKRTRCSRCCRPSSGWGSPLVLLTGTPGVDARAAGRRGAGRGRQRGGVPDESRADVEHDGGGRDGRRAGDGAARSARPRPGGLRELHPRRRARVEVAVPGPRPDAHGGARAGGVRARER